MRIFSPFITLLLILVSQLSAQNVALPDGAFKTFLVSKYPSCFVNDNGSVLLNSTCSAIVNEDSLEYHDLSGFDPLDLQGIQYFTSLRYMNFSNTRVGSSPALPASLLYLDYSNALADQPFGTIPNFLPNGLRHLNISSNNAVGIPSHLPDSLKYFDCSRNGLNSLPTLPATLETLICSSQKSYSPYSNILRNLPVLPSTLTYLDCSSSALTALPSLPQGLKYLNCSFNYVNTNPETIEFTFFNLPAALPDSLKVLNCSRNGITSLPSLPAGLETLDCSETFYYTYNEESPLAGTGLTSLPELPSGLVSLNCIKSSFYCLPHIPATLTSLAFDQDKITCLPNSANFILNPPVPLCNVTNNTHQCNAQPIISGIIFYDNNSNGIKDAGENFRPNVQVAISGGSTAFTDMNGHFELSGSIGTNTITIMPPANFVSVPASVTYSIDSYDTSLTSSIALQSLTPVDDIAALIIPLTVARPGFEMMYQIDYTNTGSSTTSPVLTFTYDNSRLTYESSSNASVINTGSSLTLAESNFSPGTRNSFVATFRVNTMALLGDSIKASLTATVNALTTIDSTFTVIRGSFDPNDKQATPKLSVLQVADGAYIDYLIRFQNTGTDTAFNIVVTDTLDAFLDDASFKLMAASHPCRVTKDGKNLAFEFINILLPDSNTNEALSHGYVRFSIKPQSGLAEGTIIPNDASIYFDYNSSIVTNIATTLIEPVNTLPLKLLSFTYLLNPVDDRVLLHWTTTAELNTHHFEIEQSNDAIHFTSIGQEAAIGTGNNSYRFSASPPIAQFYYRLKMIDRDGRFIYSPVILVKNTKPKVSITILNNPVNQTLRFSNKNPSLKNTVASLVNQQGKVMKRFVLSNGLQTVDVSTFSAGVYYLETNAGVEKIMIGAHQ